MIYLEPPADFKKQIDVVGCYIEYDGRFVLLRRQPHKPSGGMLGLPAGKVDPGETISQAMSREISEETGIQIAEADLEFIASLYVRHDDLDFIYHMFKAGFTQKPEVSVNPDEHLEYLWVTPQEALNMDLIRDQDECIEIAYKL